jgi:hypothetical protein
LHKYFTRKKKKYAGIAAIMPPLRGFDGILFGRFVAAMPRLRRKLFDDGHLDTSVS